MSATLSGQHAVVTGGGRGIGAAIALALVRNGANVTLLGRTASTLRDQVGRLRQEVPRAKVQDILVDIGDAASIESAFAAAERGFGGVGILVNNAGQALSAPIAKTSLDLWKQMLEVNLTGSFLCMQTVLPGMRQRKAGRIINIASTAGLVGYRYVAAYCAAKHGVIGLTRAVALEIATENITVNAVCPGFTDTDMVTDTVANIVAKTGRGENEIRAGLADGNPQKRLVLPEEVANAVLWLCLPGSEAMNGQALSISGGEVMR